MSKRKAALAATALVALFPWMVIESFLGGVRLAWRNSNIIWAVIDGFNGWKTYWHACVKEQWDEQA